MIVDAKDRRADLEHARYADLLSALIDGELSPAEARAAEAHAAACGPCGETLARLRLLAGAAAGMRAAEPPRDFARAVMARIEGRAPRAVRQRFALAPSMAVLLVAFGLAVTWKTHPELLGGRGKAALSDLAERPVETLTGRRADDAREPSALSAIENLAGPADKGEAVPPSVAEADAPAPPSAPPSPGTPQTPAPVAQAPAAAAPPAATKEERPAPLADLAPKARLAPAPPSAEENRPSRAAFARADAEAPPAGAGLAASYDGSAPLDVFAEKIAPPPAAPAGREGRPAAAPAAEGVSSAASSGAAPSPGRAGADRRPAVEFESVQASRPAAPPAGSAAPDPKMEFILRVEPACLPAVVSLVNERRMTSYLATQAGTRYEIQLTARPDDARGLFEALAARFRMADSIEGGTLVKEIRAK